MPAGHPGEGPRAAASGARERATAAAAMERYFKPIAAAIGAGAQRVGETTPLEPQPASEPTEEQPKPPQESERLRQPGEAKPQDLAPHGPPLRHQSQSKDQPAAEEARPAPRTAPPQEPHEPPLSPIKAAPAQPSSPVAAGALHLQMPTPSASPRVRAPRESPGAKRRAAMTEEERQAKKAAALALLPDIQPPLPPGSRPPPKPPAALAPSPSPSKPRSQSRSAAGGRSPLAAAATPGAPAPTKGAAGSAANHSAAIAAGSSGGPGGSANGTAAGGGMDAVAASTPAHATAPAASLPGGSPATPATALCEPAALRGVAGRERELAAQEGDGVLSFSVHSCAGAGSPLVDLERLVALKVLFSRQLPNMPREYIVRLLFDPRHRSLCLLKHGRVIGGITYRPFREQSFAEIVFCAVSADEQVRGYGSRLMTRMKLQALRSEGVDHFLTYADNNAIGYFAKQGFTKEIFMPRERWHGFIKDYDGGTLMECAFSEADQRWRADFPRIIASQRAAVAAVVRKLSNSHVVHPGLGAFSALKEREERGLPAPPGELRPRVAAMDIPGVNEAGWSAEDVGPTLCFAACVERASVERHQYMAAAYEARQKGADPPRSEWPSRSPAFEAAQQAQMAAMHKALTDHADAWPFQEAVDVREVPDYLTIIKDPIDLSEIGRRVVQGDYYATVEMFAADVRRMLDNCRLYNAPSTIYAKCAQRLEGFFNQQMLQKTIIMEPATHAPPGAHT